jgi:hypothetical protein
MTRRYASFGPVPRPCTPSVPLFTFPLFFRLVVVVVVVVVVAEHPYGH